MPRHIKKGDPRHGHNPKKGGPSRKKGGGS